MTARSDQPHIGLVVEGPGDLRALPVLLRAIDSADGVHCDCLGKVVTLNGRSNALKPSGIEGYVAIAGARSGAVGVLVVLDRDDEANSVQFTQELVSRAGSATGKPVQVVLAEPEFEQWIYSSAETLDIKLSPYDPAKRGLSEIRAALKPDKYVKPVWQPKLTAKMDFALAANRSQDLMRLAASFRMLRDLV